MPSDQKKKVEEKDFRHYRERKSAQETRLKNAARAFTPLVISQVIERRYTISHRCCAASQRILGTDELGKPRCNIFEGC
jgi:hypothetical protein